MERVRAIRTDFDAGQTRLGQWAEAAETATDESRQPSLVAYREPDGERALRICHSHDVRLGPAAAPMQRCQSEGNDNYHCHNVKPSLHSGPILHLASPLRRPQRGKLGRFSYGIDP